MNKKIIVGIAMAMGILSVGAFSASAADTCGKCNDKQAMQQFTQDTSALTSTLKAKDLELREQYASDSIDTRKVSVLEQELKELKNNINTAAHKYGITDCSHS